MRFLLYYFLFRVFLGNPLLALLIITFIYLMVDRQFIGLLPDIFKPFKRKSRIKALKETVKLNPADVNAYKEIGQLYLEEKNYQEAINNFLKTLGKMGEYADIHFYLGKAFYLQGQHEKGKEELLQALSINSKVGYGEPYIYLLETEIAGEKDRVEIKDLVEKIQRFGNPEILYKAGNILLKYDVQLGKDLLKEAVETYKGIPRNFRKLHRRWAFFARLKLIKH